MSQKRLAIIAFGAFAVTAIACGLIINNSRQDAASVRSLDQNTLAVTQHSNTQTTIGPDLCSNIDGNQDTVPVGYQIIGGKCYKVTKVDVPVSLQNPKSKGEIASDLCPNIAGIQNSVPTGLMLQNGQCVADPNACMQNADKPTITFVSSSTNFDPSPTGITVDPNYYQKRALFDIKFRVTAGNCGVYLSDGADYSSGGGSIGYIQQNAEPIGNGNPLPAISTNHAYGTPVMSTSRIAQENRGNSLVGQGNNAYSSSETYGLWKGNGIEKIIDPAADYINGITNYVAPHQTKEFIMRFGHDYALSKISGPQRFEARGILNRIRWSYTWGNNGGWIPRESVLPQNYMTDWVTVIFQ